jgi:hypothetical protein
MAFDNREVAIRARNLLTEQGEAKGLTLADIVLRIPIALEQWARTRIKDPSSRPHFMTPSGNITPVAGVADLTNYVDGTTKNYPIDEIRYCRIYDATRKPFTWVDSYAQLLTPRLYSATYPSCFLEGFSLYIRNPADGAVNTYITNINFTAPEIPLTVGAIHETLQQDFILYVAQMVQNGLAMTIPPVGQRAEGAS